MKSQKREIATIDKIVTVPLGIFAAYTLWYAFVGAFAGAVVVAVASFVNPEFAFRYDLTVMTTLASGGAIAGTIVGVAKFVMRHKL